MKALILLLQVFIFINLKAQPMGGNTISGTVIDSASSLPLEYATVTLFIKDNKKPLTGTVQLYLNL
jgi:hypothetical protein